MKQRNTEAQRESARLGAAERANGQKRKTDINWDNRLAKLREMLENTNHHHQDNK